MPELQWPDVEAIRKSLPVSGSERDLLNGFLDYHRATILKKIKGASEEDLKRPTNPPSTLNLLGLVKHLALNEAWWFGSQFAGQSIDIPGVDENDPESDFVVNPDETLEGIVQLYLTECEKARRIVAAAELDDLAVATNRAGEHFNLRWIILHMIEETARHNGHADFLRESLDGVTGE